MTYFHHSCPAPHILSIQFSFNLPVYILFLIWFNYHISQAGDVSAYIPTNVISITDGQVCVSTVTLQDMLIITFLLSDLPGDRVIL